MSKKTSLGAIDPNQLLTSCQKIRDTMRSLELKVKLTQLRLSTLTYVHEEPQAMSLYCFDDLIEVRNLSNLMIDQMDELRVKLDKISGESFDHQIGSQQLMYFASVWYESLAPKINATFDMANRQNIFIWESSEKRQVSPSNQQVPPPAPPGESGGDLRLRESLMRLKQSMGENENLIATIASNIENTKVTIDTIYGSLQDTKQTLERGQANTVEAINIINQSRTCKMVCLIVVIVILMVVFYFLFRLIAS